MAKIFGWLSRASTFVFLIYYTALDSIGGIGLGRTLVIVKGFEWPPEKIEVVTELLNKAWMDDWVGGVGSVISKTGSYGIFFAALFTAITLFLTKKTPTPWPPLLILIAFGWELQNSHASYHGPIAFGLLIISAAWIYFTSEIQPNIVSEVDAG